MQLTDRQIAITLAALRHFQEHIAIDPLIKFTQLDEDTILTQEEIDTICETINFND
jgi:hypothetical protein